MAATMPLQTGAKMIHFRTPCASVKRTDRKRRLPTLTSADIEDFFDHAQLATEQFKQAA